MHKFIAVIFFFGLALIDQAQAQRKLPIALVYRGDGACEQDGIYQGCSEAAADMAKKAGFEAIYFDAQGTNFELFGKAKLWIQPGGRVRKQVVAMSNDLKQHITDFVKNGGSYVGFCAGGFIAGETFGWNDKDKPPYEEKGLGLIPGKVWYYDEYDSELSDKLLAKIIKTDWSKIERYVYWELGPYFSKENYAAGEVVSFYYDKQDKVQEKAMTLFKSFGKGRVAVTAVHPESPVSWRQYYKINDKDGVDHDLAIDMINWATQNNLTLK